MNSQTWIKASPSRVLQPDPVSIVAGGFEPGTRVEIKGLLVDEADVAWRSSGMFVADHIGEVNLATAPSEAGTFVGTDPAGLIWSLCPEGSADPAFLKHPRAAMHGLGKPQIAPFSPMRLKLSAWSGATLQCESELVLDRLADGIEVEEVRTGQLRGLAFRHTDRSMSRGAIMSLTGSGGGVETTNAPLLASLGYDVFSLAYFAYEDLPGGIISIPLEYFAGGLEWMRDSFGASKIAVQGQSRGGELALILAATFPELVNGCVALVPMFASCSGWGAEGSDLGPSWTLDGKDIPYMRTDLMTPEEMRMRASRYERGLPLTPSYLEAFDRDDYRKEIATRIERASGPVLLISGEDDQMWPSRWGADLVINRLREHGFGPPFEHVALKETGHLISLPNSVTSLCRSIQHSVADIFLDCGGTPSGSARSSRHTWRKISGFYRNLFIQV